MKLTVFFCLCFVCMGFDNNELRTMETLKLEPEVIIDVGAYAGEWSQTARRVSGWQNASILMIEAEPSKKKKLDEVCEDLRQCGECSVVINAVSDREETLEFYSGESCRYCGTGASRFKENTFWFKNSKKTVLQARTIDSIVQAHGFQNKVDVLKIDVQGSELLGLMGALATLSSVKLVLIEVSVEMYNEGGVCYFEVDEWLRNKGFVLHRIMEILPYKGGAYISQMTLAYVRKNTQERKYCLKKSTSATTTDIQQTQHTIETTTTSFIMDPGTKALLLLSNLATVLLTMTLVKFFRCRK
jgi:FkbM family methyltransferase